MKFNLKKILVPTDFSSHSLSALHYAAAMAKHSEAEVILLHIIENYDENVSDLSKVINVNEAIRKEVTRKLMEIKNDNVDLWGIPISVRLENGKIHKVIYNMIEQEGVDLIVMGTHGSSGISSFGKFIMGSNAYRIVRIAECPVITVREEARDKVNFGRIVLPLDTTKETKDKVASAIKIAKVFKSTIHIVSVSSLIDTVTQNSDKLSKQLKEVSEQISAAGVKVAIKIIKNENIATTVMEFAEEIDANLIIIMTAAENQLIDMTVGSTARKVIEQSAIPVLSIRPGYQ
jgi:nucleotide-binding universal stress UspA family protein